MCESVCSLTAESSLPQENMLPIFIPVIYNDENMLHRTNKSSSRTGVVLAVVT